MEHLGTVQISTDRLVLRKFILLDAQAMFNNWANDPEVTKFLMWPAHKSVEVSENILSNWIKSYPDEKFY